MNKSDFYFDLPKHLIAQTPITNREKSRLMTINRESGNIAHETFENILDHLNSGDCLVLNDTKVIPARLIGAREKTGGNVEIFLLKQIEGDVWEALVKPGKKARIGEKIMFGNGELRAEIVDVVESGKRVVKFVYNGIFQEILDRLGEMPLPPYITEKLADNQRYQTVFAKNEGSVAAPTAGLHFIDELLSKIRAKGVNIAFITLHVGLGTFRPVTALNILDHAMHSEIFTLDSLQTDVINATKRDGGRVFAVGTTSVRTLESVADSDGFVKHGSGETDIFIYPSYKFKAVDGIITNFHLPESTLIMLVSAFMTRELTLAAYQKAIDENYRFFSFGDAMLIY